MVDIARRWQGGQPVRLEAYLEQYPELGLDEAGVADLIHVEFQVRRQAGVAGEWGEYAQRFPRHVTQLRELVEHVGTSRAEPGAAAALSQQGKS